MIVRLIFSTQTGTAFSQEILTVSTWNFQLLRFTIMGFIQNLWAESYHAFLLTGWWLLLYRQRNTGRSHKGIWKGTDKRITLLKTHCPVTAKRTCKVSDLTSPLLYHGTVGCVRSVKDCPTAYRLRLVPWPHYVFFFSWHNKSTHEFSSILQALILSHTLSILLFHNPSNCTVYRLVVRLISEIHFCNND